MEFQPGESGTESRPLPVEEEGKPLEEELKAAGEDSERFSLPFGLFFVICIFGLCMLIFSSTRTAGILLLGFFGLYMLTGVASIVIRGILDRDR